MKLFSVTFYKVQWYIQVVGGNDGERFLLHLKVLLRKLISKEFSGAAYIRTPKWWFRLRRRSHMFVTPICQVANTHTYYPRESFRGRLWNQMRKFVCLLPR